MRRWVEVEGGGGTFSLFDGVFCVFAQQWYTSTMNLIGTWLTDRMDLQLHVYQLKILIRVVKVRQTPPPPLPFTRSKPWLGSSQVGPGFGGCWRPRGEGLQSPPERKPCQEPSLQGRNLSQTHPVWWGNIA